MKRHLTGTWHNQNGSELDLVVSPDGRISGRFRSATGLAARGAAECEVTGYVAGDLVTFAANFGEHDSLTAWTGHLVVEGGETRIQTQWHMTVAVPGKPDERELWKGIWTGADTFRRGPAKRTSEPLSIPSQPVPDRL